MSISPREGTDFGARHSSISEEDPCSNEDGSGLHSSVLDSDFPRNDCNPIDVEDAISQQQQQQQQPPLIDPSMHGDIDGANTQARMKSRHGRNTLLEAPFFAQSHNFTIHNSQFYACSGHGFNSREQEDVPSTAFCVIPKHKLRFQFNSAKRKKCDVVVQVFEGPKAKQTWQKTLKYSRCLMNAHFLDIVGVSPSSDCSSDPYYIVFDGTSSRSTHRLIASTLRGDKEATVIGLRAVYGITLGFDYISKTINPLSKLRIDEFDVFSDDFGHTQLTFTPNALGSSTLNRQPLSATNVETLSLERSSMMPTIPYTMSSACFASHTIRCDMYFKGDEADQHIKEEFTNSRRLTPQIESTGDPEISSVANTSQAAKRPPRREIIWNASGFSKSSLSDISQTYDNVIFNDSIQLPRRLGRRVIGYRRACSCEGYSREEITFTPDAFRNAVLIYQQPSPNERCGLCGELLPAPSIIPQPIVPDNHHSTSPLYVSGPSRIPSYTPSPISPATSLGEPTMKRRTDPTQLEVLNETHA
ncbi:hypothetical protein BT96DRAFT_988007 [Gymnopus androsaceus JB14]|uniref:Uncharacterized protein n=1 Tax=Gymnopus androsaceus JB14 TaxID=1447944 RepID=A0A6A4IB73_9AGAR|nr:hypothetical protein BT96DRAFT_988007 [Gymnopus androsaceus JB14]